ncbi:twin transmembrane helix small protein [Hasllibacter sp. MH4015]|uniref:twin transmembrane helix small protein n=1 Tax=Hasllibacter sp. MH4015 TaxID=2854029 RepID=UPI001CD5B05B|nr:twin transmembrane helix small protein [Hasllibacter sp. MH4015]
MTDDPLLLAGLIACAAVLVVLLLGINSFRRGGTDGSKRSNKLMQWRIGLQFLAIVLLLAFVFFRRQAGG